MKYYLHDSNSFNDEKITQLFIKFGYEGLGLFYTALEKIALQEKPVSTEVLKHQLKVGKRLNKCWSFMEEIELISSNNGETFNKQLLNFSEKYQIKKEKNAKRISEWREKQDVKENVTRSESVRNTPKVKESKVNRSKVNIEFDIFWNLYDKKKGDKDSCKRKWDKLKEDEQQKIIDIIPEWKKQFSDIQYQPFPSTFLNQKRWNDELIINKIANEETGRNTTQSSEPNDGGWKIHR